MIYVTRAASVRPCVSPPWIHDDLVAFVYKNLYTR
nr:MAG TPA: hypothetical protein [Caudoviricetes sp.]